MSKKKSDIQKAIDKYDVEIATLQTKIESLEQVKADLQAIVDEKASAKAKAAKAKQPKAVKVPKAAKAAVAPAAPTDQADPFTGVQ